MQGTQLSPVVHPSKGNSKPVEIYLQVDGDLTQKSHEKKRHNDTTTKSKPLRATDIEYDPTLIADLSDQDEPTSRLLQGNSIGD